MISFAILLALVLSMTAFRECGSAEKRSVEQNVTLGVRIATKALPAGVATMRTLREHGKVEASTNLFLAERALEFNSALRRFGQLALDGADAATLQAQLEAVIDFAQGLERDGTLKLKNGDTQFVFELLSGGAKNGLLIALDELKGSNAKAVTFTLDADTRKSLEELKPQFEENDKLLREAITRLGGQP